ncbi:MAG TPA: molybdopterin biosynthesis protein MoeY [Rhodocyclaceae bacterium]|nr:molybdopterin biosynthesis protein MoeY [Rhodocyclaceae bacterium]
MPVDPLCSCIEKRTVQRRPMRMNALSTEWIQALEQAVGKDYQLQFFSTISLRSKVAGLLWRGAHIRLTCPEAYPVHREIIEWGARFSDDRIPEQAVGVDPLTARLMYWVLQSWKRVVFFNGFMMGTVWPRIQLDVIPAIACSAHVLLQPRVVPTSLQDRVEAGMALQRLWLTATRLGLHLQPQMTPLIFRWYVQAGQAMSASTKINAAADRLTNQLDEFFGLARGDSAMFFCRIGVCQPPVSRSLRKSLSLLMRG